MESSYTLLLLSRLFCKRACQSDGEIHTKKAIVGLQHEDQWKHVWVLGNDVVQLVENIVF
eukprot:5853394-Ditylum_brightwellii.AAC.1